VAHRAAAAKVGDEITDARLHLLQRQFAEVERLHFRRGHARRAVAVITIQRPARMHDS